MATDTLAKRLRNLASPVDSTNPLDQQPLERAEPFDLVFRTVRSDGTRRRPRNPQNLSATAIASSTTSVLYEQRQTWTGAMPATPAATACPGGGWTSERESCATSSTGRGRCSTTRAARRPAPTTS